MANEKQVTVRVVTDVEDAEVQNLENLINKIDAEHPNIKVDVQDGEIDSAQGKADKLDNTEIDLNVNNIAAMESIDQISSGFDRLKAGASELGQKMGEVLESAGKQETNKTFLAMNIGADQASKKLSEINNLVASLPGDDTAMQGLLSQAAAKNAQMTTNELTNMGNAAADYMAAMSYYGKSATETQQDLTNYILAGNTGEIERSPILAAHLDKLKQASTVQERTLALQQALNAEGWAGMAGQDTYNNKLQTFMGMIERGKYNLGGMFQEGAKGAMDFIMGLDSASGGLVGMGIAATTMMSPLTDAVMGLGQLSTGVTALKTAYTALIPTQWAEAVAGWASIGWIVLAVALGLALGAAIIYLYNNVDWFRQGVDNLVLALQNFVGMIYGTVTGAVQWLSNLFTNFTNQLGLNTNNWIEAVLGFILFIPTLPLQLGIALANAIAKTLGFGNNFVQGLMNAGSRAVSGFLNYIRQIPGMVMAEFNRTLQLVGQFISSLPQRVWDMGTAIIDALKSSLGIGSPGYMYYMLEGELQRLDNLPGDMTGSITGNIESMGSSMVTGFESAQFANGSTPVGGVNQTFNIEIGSVDSEERINEIVEVIRRELSWNNATAGRTI